MNAANREDDAAGPLEERGIDRITDRNRGPGDRQNGRRLDHMRHDQFGALAGTMS